MKRIMLALAAVVTLLVGTTALASEAAAYSNTPSNTFHWCIGTLHVTSSQVPVYEECYEIYANYVAALNDGHMGDYLVYSLYTADNYGGWSLALEAPRGCATGPLWLPQMPSGWNDAVASEKVWDGNCGISYEYKNNGYSTYLGDCGLAGPDINCKSFPSGVRYQMSSNFTAYH